MKKMILGALLLVSVVAFAQKRDGLRTMGLRFVAPTVKNVNQVDDEERGEIVYQTSDEQFYGFDGTNWNKLSAGESLLPAGVILPFGGTAAPSGFLLADGAAYLIADHPDLHAAIGTAFGDGTKNADGTNTNHAAGTAFNVPDLRGRFMRGVDGTAGRDIDKTARPYATSPNNGGGNSGNAVGSIQGQATRKNGLSIIDPGHAHYTGLGSGSATPGGVLGVTSLNPNQGYTNTANTNVSISNGDSETRPINIYVNYIIKK
ncbi:phage tail protein [Bdellovibrio sp. HCB-110]|uniref:phage tail protein n=1 Tax=Bdellovibrio sp. HCB-110 TaxID=3391182 RepID=UPI0039B5F3C7